MTITINNELYSERATTTVPLGRWREPEGIQGNSRGIEISAIYTDGLSIGQRLSSHMFDGPTVAEIILIAANKSGYMSLKSFRECTLLKLNSETMREGWWPWSPIHLPRSNKPYKNQNTLRCIGTVSW